jgi:hypothetical protein
VAARIAQLSTPPPKPNLSVKVKTLAELQSSKVARLTTKIAVTEGEIDRLKREQMRAQEAVQRSLDVQKAAALEVLERRVALERVIRGGGGGEGDERLEKEFVGAKEELERGFVSAKEALVSGRPEDMSKILQEDVSISFGRGLGKGESAMGRGSGMVVGNGGETVMEKVKRLFEKMERDARKGVVSEGAKMVLDALAKQQQRGGEGDGNEAIFEALVQALSLDEKGVTT